MLVRSALPRLFSNFRSNRISFDTEGTGLIPYGPPEYWGYYPARPFAFAFCDGEGNTAYFRWKVEPSTRRVVLGTPAEQAILKRIATDNTLQLVGHNIAYDLRMLEAMGYTITNHNVDDTMVLAHVVTAGDELSYALKPLCKKYLAFPDDDEKELEHAVAEARREARAKGWLIAGGKKEVERGERVVFAGNKPVKADYWLAPPDLCQRYAVGDVERAMMLYLLMVAELDRDPRIRATYEREMQLFWVLRKMEKRGTRVYPDWTEHLVVWYTQYMAKMRKMADANGGAGMNFMSPKQLTHKFYTELGYAPMYTEKGNMALGKDKLAELGATDEDTGEFKDPLAKAVLEWRAAKQSIKSFLNIYAKFWYPTSYPGRTGNAVRCPDGKWDGSKGVWILHPNYNQTGAVTGRMTCCIAEDTPIEIARDLSQHPEGIPVQDVRPGDWAYCMDEDTGTLHLRKVKKVWNRGIAHALVRVHWRGKQGKGRQRIGHLDVTPEHKLRTVDGQWVAARDLCPGDHIAAIHRDSPRNRARVAVTEQSLQYESRFILEEMARARALPGMHAHHCNGNFQDNRPSNLEWRSEHLHKSDHSKGENNGNYTHWTRETITTTLEKYRWSMTLACRGEHLDYTCFRKHVKEFYSLETVKKFARGLRGRPNNPYYDRGIGGNHRVIRVEPLTVMRPVYDLWIDEHHNFFAGELSAKNSDPNLQQVASATTGLRKADIPARPRECFGPRPGCLWYLPDYSQIEVWLFAFMSGEANMQELLLSGYDFHQGVADKSFVRKPDYEQRKKYYRKLAKLIMFGKLYGGGVGTEQRPGRMTKLLQMPFREAKAFIDSFEEQFSSVVTFMRKMTNEATANGEAWNLYGRRYKLEREWAYKVVNYLIQGSAADLLKVATMRVDWMLDHRWQHPLLGLLNTVHDEMIIEVPFESHSMRLMQDIVWVMQMDSEHCGIPVPLPVGMKVAWKRWSHTVDIKLPPWVKGGVPRDEAPFAELREFMQDCPYKVDASLKVEAHHEVRPHQPVQRHLSSGPHHTAKAHARVPF